MRMNELQRKLEIPTERLDEINSLLLDTDNRAMQAFLETVQNDGSPDEINRKAAKGRDLCVATSANPCPIEPAPSRPQVVPVQTIPCAVGCVLYKRKLTGEEGAKRGCASKFSH